MRRSAAEGGCASAIVLAGRGAGHGGKAQDHGQDHLGPGDIVAGDRPVNQDSRPPEELPRDATAALQAELPERRTVADSRGLGWLSADERYLHHGGRDATRVA